MIVSFAHKGLERFFLTGSKGGIQPDHSRRLQILLTRLHAAQVAKDMDMPGFRLHSLRGDLNEYWSVSVNANWRIIFKFTALGAEVVDYVDYH